MAVQAAHVSVAAIAQAVATNNAAALARQPAAHDQISVRRGRSRGIGTRTSGVERTDTFMMELEGGCYYGFGLGRSTLLYRPPFDDRRAPDMFLEEQGCSLAMERRTLA
jgi:hypothetical protein